MTESSLPNDPERLLHYYMYYSSAKTLTAIYDIISEIQMFTIEDYWPVGSVEFQAAADVLEALKKLIAIKQNQMVAKSHEQLD